MNKHHTFVLKLFPLPCNLTQKGGLLHFVGLVVISLSKNLFAYILKQKMKHYNYIGVFMSFCYANIFQTFNCKKLHIYHYMITVTSTRYHIKYMNQCLFFFYKNSEWINFSPLKLQRNVFMICTIHPVLNMSQ